MNNESFCHIMNNLQFRETQKTGFQSVFSLMEESFPKGEYRLKEKQEELLLREEYKIIGLYREETLLGFAAVWHLPSCTFLEHIAVKKEMRGLGIGKEIMKNIINSSPNGLILEVEEPHNAVQIKRVQFYESLGCKLSEFGYLQPNLQPSEDKIFLKLMSHGKEINSESFSMLKDELFSAVYKEYII